MKNPSKKFKLLRVIIILTLISQTSLAAAFSDISNNNKYATAINYLASQGIINGYPDGSFKPDNNVSRVEFLKILLESSSINSNDTQTQTGFSDIDENAWYAKYVRKAKQENWVQGYADNTFKPDQNINKVEALKIIAKVQNWQTKLSLTSAPFMDTSVSAWYSIYIDYAKSHNFLEEAGNFFIPDAYFTRAQVSEILFRIFLTGQKQATVFSKSLLQNLPTEQTKNTNQTGTNLTPPPEKIPTQDFIPESFKNYPDNFFGNVQLNENFPNIFYMNEVYHFKGKILSGSYNHAFVFLAAPNANQDQYTNYSTAVGGMDFDIPVIFRKTGNYKLGLILGNSGQSKVADISVLSPLQNASNLNSDAPTATSVSYQNGSTTFNWNSNTNNLIKLVIFQGTKVKSYMFRQPTNSFNIQYIDFNSFKEGTVNYQIQGAKLASSAPLTLNSGWAASTTGSFTATTNTYRSINSQEITVNSFKDLFNQIQTVSISGVTKANTYKQAAVIKPNGLVENFDLNTNVATIDYLGSKIIPSGGNFNFNYTPNIAGKYIFEINNQNGEAVFNVPVYVNIGIPLIPDYFDLNPDPQLIGSFNLSDARNQLLNLINQDRIKYGFSAVKLDSDLNNLSQLHSEDMVKRNFFSHINPDGQTPDDRRKELGITTGVGENLAFSPNIADGHFGLMQSAIHRKNILDSKWTRIGIGIAKAANGYIYITEEFSTSPLNGVNLGTIQNNILNQINLKRIQLSLVNLTTDNSLSSVANQWTVKMVTENFFDFLSPNGASLSALIASDIPNKVVQAVILEASDQDNLIDEVLTGEDVTKNIWTKIGMSLGMDNMGTLKLTILYTKI